MDKPPVFAAKAQRWVEDMGIDKAVQESECDVKNGDRETARGAVSA